jgi:hypothetical protein
MNCNRYIKKNLGHRVRLKSLKHLFLRYVHSPWEHKKKCFCQIKAEILKFMWIVKKRNYVAASKLKNPTYFTFSCEMSDRTKLLTKSEWSGGNGGKLVSLGLRKSSSGNLKSRGSRRKSV